MKQTRSVICTHTHTRAQVRRIWFILLLYCYYENSVLIKIQAACLPAPSPHPTPRWNARIILSFLWFMEKLRRANVYAQVQSSIRGKRFNYWNENWVPNVETKKMGRPDEASARRSKVKWISILIEITSVEIHYKCEKIAIRSRIVLPNRECRPQFVMAKLIIVADVNHNYYWMITVLSH